MEKEFIIIDDTKYETKVSNKFRNRKVYTKPNPLEVNSFIPGTVYKILVREGESVNKGKDLIIIEAMKMKNTIKTPITGKVKKIAVKVGERVPKGTLLIELE